MAKIGFLFVCLLSLLFLVNTCAAVDFHVSPGTKVAHPGETVSYDLSASLTSDDDPAYYPMTEIFSIDQPIQYWTYSFSKNSVELNDLSTTNSSVLQITVPSNATSGTYTHSVNATCYDSEGIQVDVPTQIDVRVVNTDVQIPEFPSVALPVAAVLGIVAIFGRRKT